MEKPLGDLEQHNKIPRVFLLLYFGLIAWGVWYIAAYTPEISGWSQYKVLQKETEAERDSAAASSSLAENPYEHDPKAIAEGQSIYKENCSGCHRDDLKGEVGPDLTGPLRYGETDGKKFEAVSKGKPNGMPSFESRLGRDRIWKVLSYVDSVREYGSRP